MLRQNNFTPEIKHFDTDILIIGGGTAGCFAAVEVRKHSPDASITIMEKAHVARSGACSAGLDAINTYIPPDKTPEDLVRWCRDQVGGGPLREDLALNNARELNDAVDDLERWGLPFLRDENGKIRYRGQWDISIHGEQLKPIMAEQAAKAGAAIHNRVTATQLMVSGGKCSGAIGFSVRTGALHVYRAKSVIVATGGACGLYKSYTADATSSHHQTWMCPYCVGTGYAIGIRQGAEMTSMEQRWVATRSKDFCGPIDTISVGYKAPIINARGEKIMQHYAHLGGDAAPRYIRANAPMEEWLAGRAPTYCDTRHLSQEQAHEMLVDYLNERPSFVLYLAARNQDVTKEPIEIYGSDPYIVGGHTQSGFWVDIGMMTTLPGLFAAGETAGGHPNKFVGGCAADGKIAARSALKYIRDIDFAPIEQNALNREAERIFAPKLRADSGEDGITPVEMEERMQRLMDEYAGGVSQFYRTNEERLDYALKELARLKQQVHFLKAVDWHELMLAHDVIDRLDVAEVLCHHLKSRKETRWPGWQTRSDYPEINPELNCFIESVMNPETGEIKTFTRPYERLV